MKIVISQPRYLPAINYIHRLKFADQFVLFDTVQRNGRDCENRNKLLIPEPKWLTIPIQSSSRALVKNTEMDGLSWVNQHKDIIRQNYGSHPHYDESVLDAYYADFSGNSFVDNMNTGLKNICGLLDFFPNIIKASEIETDEHLAARGPDKLAAICKSIDGASTYISGPNGRDYGVNDSFSGTGINVLYHQFDNPEYKQPGQNSFFTYMGFFDVIFSMGLSWLVDYVNKEPELID